MSCKCTDDHDKEILASGRFMDFVRRGRWEYADRRGIKGVVGMFPVTAAGELVLVEQYRPPMDTCCIEVPAGLVGDGAADDDEPFEVAARRELIEETGYDAGCIIHLFDGVPSAGATSEVFRFFLCLDLKRIGDGGGDHAEDICVHVVPIAQVPAFLDAQYAAGKCIDAKIYAGLYFAEHADAFRPAP